MKMANFMHVKWLKVTRCLKSLLNIRRSFATQTRRVKSIPGVPRQGMTVMLLRVKPDSFIIMTLLNRSLVGLSVTKCLEA